MQDAMPGVRSHGCGDGRPDYGLFISFFGGVSGLAHSSQLGLAPEQSPTEAFKVCLEDICLWCMKTCLTLEQHSNAPVLALFFALG